LCLFEEGNHMACISDYEQFCQKNKKYYCFFCAKYFRRKRDFRHFCRSPDANICHACYRPIADSSFCDKDSHKYCNIFICKPSDHHPWKCQKCLQSSTTLSCFEAHKLVCGRGVRFSCCNSFIHKSDSLTNLTLLKEQHVCSKIKCRHCRAHLFQELDESHQCQIKKFAPSENFPNIAFVHFIFGEKNCTIHGKVDRPVLGSLLCPLSTDISTFHVFLSNGHEQSNVSMQNIRFYHPNHVTCPYKPNMTELKSKSPKSITENMVLYIFENLTNCTLVCFDSTGKIMMTLIDMLTSQGISPKIEMSHNMPIFLKVREINLIILNAVNFIPFKDIFDLLPSDFFPSHGLCTLR